ncbi:M56 family metallopeptidase [Streptomyces sp. NPDC003442]
MSDEPPDTGNRAFWALVGFSLTVRVGVAYLACCLTSALVRQVSHRGAGALLSVSVWAGVTLLALAAAGTARSAARVWRGLRATLSMIRAVRSGAVDASPAVRTASERAGLASRVKLTKSADPFAFTYGLLFPQVVVSSGLVAIATPEELAAVLSHEHEHVRSRDPLKALISTALATRNFTLPLLEHLRAVFVFGRELAADRRAVARCGTSAVAGALLKATDAPRWARAAPAAAMSGTDQLEARITQLEAGWPPRPAPPTPRHVFATLTGVAVYVWALTGSAALIATGWTCMG